MIENDEILNLRKAIKALEGQKSFIGEIAVNSSIFVLKEKIEILTLKNRNTSKQLRKYVTVIFADVSGFTTICSENDAENVTAAINTLWDALDAIIVNHGGYVDKHIGDCVMAVWGLDGVREDDPFRAVRAAVAMQDAAKSIYTESDGLIPPFSIRIGVHSGSVFITSIGLNKEYTVMGDTVNVASRLQTNALLGSVLISHRTWKHVKTEFTFQKQSPIKLKGITDKLDTYIVKDILSDSFAKVSASIFGVETVMVGRENELALLQKILDKVSTSKVTELVTIIGEAGIGKSRLLHEFRLSVESNNQKAVFLNARCAQSMIDTPCAVFRDILKINFSIKENDSILALFKKFEEGMADALSIQEIHLACNFVGFDMSASKYIQRVEGDSSLTAAGRIALVKYFKIIAARGKTFIYLEDLHWADSVSLDLIQEIVKEIPNEELFVLCLARPPLLEREPNWGNNLPNTFIKLKSLSTLQSTLLVENILDKIQNIPTKLLNLIITNADGNPFYVEELVKMLVEDRVISLERGTVRIDSFSEEKVPFTLTGVLQARLDSLPAVERSLLQMASVVGRSFWDKIVQDISTHNAIQLTKLLHLIESHDLVHKMNSSAFSNANEYLFKHAILRDVTYETVLLKVRKKYHKRIAVWLEENSTERIDEFTSIIAYHYENGEDWQNAAIWLVKSGKSAKDLSAYKEALLYFRRALNIPSKFLEKNTIAQLHLYCGSCLEKLSYYDEAREELDRAIHISEQYSFYTIQADSLLAHAWIAMLTGCSSSEIKGYAEEAFIIAKKSESPSILAKALMRISDFEEDKSFNKVIAYYDKAFSIYSEIENKNGLAITLLNMGNICLEYGFFDKAEKCYKESLELYTEIGSRWGIANCLGNIGCVLVEKKSNKKACDFFTENLEVSKSIGDKEGEVISNLNLGQTAISLNNSKKALEYLDVSLGIAISVSLLPLARQALMLQARAYLVLNQKDKAALILLVLEKEVKSGNFKEDLTEIHKELKEFKLTNHYKEICKQAETLDVHTLSSFLLLK